MARQPGARAALEREHERLQAQMLDAHGREPPPSAPPGSPGAAREAEAARDAAMATRGESRAGGARGAQLLPTVVRRPAAAAGGAPLPAAEVRAAAALVGELRALLSSLQARRPAPRSPLAARGSSGPGGANLARPRRGGR